MTKLSYRKQYSFLIVVARADLSNRKRGDYEFAEHHIFPKCLSRARGQPADNRSCNLVLLSRHEHLEAHRLLFLLHPNNADLARTYAWMRNMLEKHPSDAEYFAATKVKRAEDAKRWTGAGNPVHKPKNKAAKSKLMSELNLTNNPSKSTKNRAAKAELLRSSNPKKSIGERRAQASRSRVYMLSKDSPNKVQAVCPSCSKAGNLPNMKRWHFDNCLEHPDNAGLTRKQIKEKLHDDGN